MNSWKWLTGLFFLLVIVDGALRKWVLPSQSAALFVLKDVVLWGGFLLYSLRRSPIDLPRPLRSTWVPVLLVGYIYLVLVQAFNPRMPSLTVSALGLKAHLAYLPLVVLMPALISDVTERQMHHFIWGYALLIVLPLGALSVYQFYSSPTAWINQYVREHASIATAGGHVRVISTFSYIGSHTAYLTFNSFLSVGVLLAGLRWKNRGLLTLGGLLLAAMAVVLPMTGSRGPVLIVLGALAVLFAVAEIPGRSWFAVLVFLIGAMLWWSMGETWVTEGWAALMERSVQAGGTEGAWKRVEGVLSGPISGIERGGLFGYGAGASHQAAPRFVPGTLGHEWLPEGFIESFIARVIIELGSLGWLLLLALKGTLLYFAYQTVQRARRPLGLIVGVTAFCLLLVKLPFPIVFNAVASAFYWGSVGTMLGIWSVQQLHLTSHAVHRSSVATSSL